jgi:hypothetical protein
MTNVMIPLSVIFNILSLSVCCLRECVICDCVNNHAKLVFKNCTTSLYNS